GYRREPLRESSASRRMTDVDDSRRRLKIEQAILLDRQPDVEVDAAEERYALHGDARDLDGALQNRGHARNLDRQREGIDPTPQHTPPGDGVAVGILLPQVVFRADVDRDHGAAAESLAHDVGGQIAKEAAVDQQISVEDDRRQDGG